MGVWRLNETAASPAPNIVANAGTLASDGNGYVVMDILKAQAGKPVTSAPAERLVEAAAAGGYRELPVTSVHAARIATLPLHHRDPFDRLLVAQALEEPARLLTVDRKLAPYSELVMVV